MWTARRRASDAEVAEALCSLSGDNCVSDDNWTRNVQAREFRGEKGRVGSVRRSTYGSIASIRAMSKYYYFFIVWAACCYITSMEFVEAVSFTRVCPLQNEPIIILEYNTTTKEYVRSNTTVEDIVSEANDNGQTTVPTLDALAEQNLFPARQCPCVSPSTMDQSPKYCTVASGDVCGVQRTEGYIGNEEGDEIVSCFLINSRTIFVRNAWPVVVLWYGALFIFSLATDNGRHARAYITGLLPCFRDNATRIADRILENEMRIRDRMRVAALLQQRRMWLAQQQAAQRFGFAGGGGTPDMDDPFDEDPTAPLVLKTRIFHKPRKVSNEENDNSGCRDDKNDNDLKNKQEFQNETPKKNAANSSSLNAAAATTPSTQATCDSFDDEETGDVRSPLYDNRSNDGTTVDTRDHDLPAPLILSNHSYMDQSGDDVDLENSNTSDVDDADDNAATSFADNVLQSKALSHGEESTSNKVGKENLQSDIVSLDEQSINIDVPVRDGSQGEDAEHQSVSSSSSSSFDDDDYNERYDNNDNFDDIALNDDEDQGAVSRMLSVPAEHVPESEFTDVLGGLSQLPLSTNEGDAHVHDNDKMSLDDEDDDDVVCTICLCVVEDGDCVGALRGCEHIFHVDCLKDWLKRRNVCPLCQTPNVAARRVRRRPQQAQQQQRALAALNQLASAVTRDDNNNRESHIWLRDANGGTGIVGDEEYAIFLRELEQVDDLMASLGAAGTRDDDANIEMSNNATVNDNISASNPSNETNPRTSVTGNSDTNNQDGGDNNETGDNRNSTSSRTGRRSRVLRVSRGTGNGRQQRVSGRSRGSNRRSGRSSRSSLSTRTTSRSLGTRGSRNRMSGTSARRLTSPIDAADAVAEGLASLRMLPPNSYYFQNQDMAAAINARRQRGSSLFQSDEDDTTTDDAWMNTTRDRLNAAGGNGAGTGRGSLIRFGQQQQQQQPRQLQPQLPQPSPPRRRGRGRLVRGYYRRGSSSFGDRNDAAGHDNDNNNRNGTGVMDPRVRTYRTRGPNGETRVVYRLDRIHGFTRADDVGNRNSSNSPGRGGSGSTADNNNASTTNGGDHTIGTSTSNNNSPRHQRFQSQGDGGSGNTDVLSFPWNLVPSSIQTSRFTRMLTGASRSNPNSNSTNQSGGSTNNIGGGGDGDGNGVMNNANATDAETNNEAAPTELQAQDLEGENSANTLGRDDEEVHRIVTDTEEDEETGGIHMNHREHQNSIPRNNNSS